MRQATQLDDRTLWYDGDSTVPANKIIELVSAGIPTTGLFVEELTKDIEQFNKFVTDDEKITVKGEVRDLTFEWTIPQEYRDLDVNEFVIDKLVDEIDTLPLHNIDTETKKRTERYAQEINLYKSLDLYDILRTLIYIINTLQSNNIVWGVGRGSSVSSYVLYLIGVHDVDSVKYELDITDFLRSGE